MTAWLTPEEVGRLTDTAPRSYTAQRKRLVEMGARAPGAPHGKLPAKPRDREYLATILERWEPQSRFNFAHTIKELRAKK